MKKLTASAVVLVIAVVGVTVGVVRSRHEAESKEPRLETPHQRLARVNAEQKEKAAQEKKAKEEAEAKKLADDLAAARKVREDLASEREAARKEAEKIIEELLDRLKVEPKAYSFRDKEVRKDPADAPQLKWRELLATDGRFVTEDLEKMRGFVKAIGEKRGMEAAKIADDINWKWRFKSRVMEDVVYEIARDLAWKDQIAREQPEWDARGKDVAESEPQLVLRPLNNKGQEVRCNAVAVSPDGSMIATIGGYRLTLWSAKDGKEVKVFGEYYADHRLAFSPDGKFLVSGVLGGSHFVTDLQKLEKVATLKSEDRWFGADARWFGTYLAIGGVEEVSVWDSADNWKQVFVDKMPTRAPRVRDLTLKDGKVSRMLIQGWNLVEWSEGKTQTLSEKGSDEFLLDIHKSVGLRRTKDGLQLRSYPEGQVLCSFGGKYDIAQFSSDGRYVVAWETSDGWIRAYDLEGREVFKKRYGKGTDAKLGFDWGASPDGGAAMAPAGDGEYLIAAGGTGDRTVQVWRVRLP